jgi:cysteine sulfinate desulfinase/cysteine desulfurase-like protein
VEPSQTLLAMDMPPEEALASLRISFGWTNTREQLDQFFPLLMREVDALRRDTGALR